MKHPTCENCGYTRKVGEFGVTGECTQCRAPIKDDTPHAVPALQKTLPKQRREASRHAKATKPPIHTAFNKKIALAAPLLIITGVFCPLVQAPIVGQLTMFTQSKVDAIVFICASIISFYFTFKEDYKFHLYAGLAILADLIYSTVTIMIKLDKIKDDLNASLKDNPFRGIADAAIGSMNMQWGWGVLIVGAALFIIADLYRENDTF